MNESEEPQVVPDYQSPGSDSDEEAFRHTRVRHSSLDLTTNTTVKMVVGGLIGATPVRQPMAVPGSPPVQPLANDTSPNSSGVRPLSVHNTPEEQPGPRTWRVPRDSPSAARAARAAFYGGAADSADALASSSLLWTSTSGTFGENSVLSPLPSVHQVGGGPVAQSAETSPNPEYDPHVASEGRGMRKSMSYSISITEADKALSQNGSSGNSGGPNSARLGESKSADSLRDDQPYSDSNRDLMQGFHDATRFARSAESSPMVRGARTMNMGDESSPESRASAPLYNPSPNSSASHSSPMPSSGSDELLSTRRLPPSHDPSPNSSSTSSHSLPPSPQSTGAESLGQRARPLPAMSMPPSHSGSTSSQARPFTVLSLQRPLSLCAAPSTLGVLLTSGPLFAQAQSLPLDAMTISVRGEPVQVVNVLRSEVSSRCYFVASVRAGGGPRSRGPTAALTADSPGVIAEQGASPGESSLAFTVSIVPELVELQLSLRRSDLAACASFGMVDFNCAAEVSLQSAAGLSFSTWTCTGKFSKTRVRPSVAADTSPESGSKATVMGWVLTDVLVELRRGTSSLPNTPYATATTATPSPLDAPASAGYVVPELYFPEAAMHDVPPHAQHHHQVHQRQAQYAPRSAGGSHVPHHQHHLQHQHAYMHEDPYAMAGGYGEYPARMPPRALPGHMAHMHHHQAGSYAPYGNPVMRGHGQWAPQSPYDYPNADPHMNGLPLAPSGSMSGPGTPRTPGGSVMRRPRAHGHGHGHRLSPGFGGGHPHGPRHSRSRGATPQTSPAVRHRQLRGGGGGGGGAGGDGDGGNSPAVYPLPPKAAEYRQLNPLIDLINEMMASGTPWPEPAEDPILSHIVGRVVLVAKSQCGSRFLQERITQGSSAYLELVYAETFEQFGQLMLDLFGNYLCQAVVEKCSDEQRTRLLVHLRNDIPRISHDRQGTRAVQKLVSTSRGSAEQRRHVTDSVRRNLLHLIMDPNASHVVHALLDHYPRDELDFVFAEALSALPKLAVDQHGLCVLKSCITLASAEDFVRFADAIVEHVLDLVNNEYGNYIVQHLIEQKDTACNSRVDARLRGNYGSLAQRKFSSNVVEKCLRLADRTWRQAILGELLDASTLAQVLRDSYGNFVLQNALFVANDDERRHLIELVHPHVPSLRKNLRRKWQRLISEANAGTLDPSAYQRTRNAKSGKHNSHRGNGRGRRRSGPGGPRAPRPDMRVNGDSASYNGNGGRHAHNHNSQRGHSDRGGRGRRSGAGRRRQQRGRRY